MSALAVVRDFGLTFSLRRFTVGVLIGDLEPTADDWVRPVVVMPLPFVGVHFDVRVRAHA